MPVDYPLRDLVASAADSRTPVVRRAMRTTASPAGRAASKLPLRWWLWPHLLSLDAPFVALVWQDWWARHQGTSLTAAQRAVLGLGVWLIYLADRLADASRRDGEDRLPTRHGFAARGWRPLTALALLIAGLLTVLAPTMLRPAEFRDGLTFLAAAGGYFWLIHRRPSAPWTAIVPKEAVVAGFFAAGTAFFVLGRGASSPTRMVAAVVLFGGVCFLNCALISAWERTTGDRRDPYSLLNAFPGLLDGGLRRGCWVLATLSGAAAWSCQASIFVPVAISAAALAMLDRYQRRISEDALRCLVDVVLLTPLICAAVMAMFP